VEVGTDVKCNGEPTGSIKQIEIITPSGFTLRFDDSIHQDRLRDLVGAIDQLGNGAAMHVLAVRRGSQGPIHPLENILATFN